MFSTSPTSVKVFSPAKFVKVNVSRQAKRSRMPPNFANLKNNHQATTTDRRDSNTGLQKDKNQFPPRRDLEQPITIVFGNSI